MKKNVLFLFIIFFIFSCTSGNGLYFMSSEIETVKITHALRNPDRYTVKLITVLTVNRDKIINRKQLLELAHSSYLSKQRNQEILITDFNLLDGYTTGVTATDYSSTLIVVAKNSSDTVSFNVIVIEDKNFNSGR